MDRQNEKVPKNEDIMELTLDQMGRISGEVNSALTELDEEGVDIGGDYLLPYHHITDPISPPGQ